MQTFGYTPFLQLNLPEYYELIDPTDINSNTYTIESVLFYLRYIHESIRLTIEKEKWSTTTNAAGYYTNTIELSKALICRKLGSNLYIPLNKTEVDDSSDLDISLDGGVELDSGIVSDYGLIRFSSFSNFNLMFYSESIPTNDIPIKVKGFRLNADINPYMN